MAGRYLSHKRYLYTFESYAAYHVAAMKKVASIGPFLDIYDLMA
jgi:hypothetical protein